MLTKDDDSNGGGVDQSSCCNCGCKVCGQVTTVVRRPTTVDASTITSEDVSSWSPVELFVCSELDCDFRSKSLSEVQKHKKGRHKCGKKRPSTKQQRPSRRVKHRKKSYFEEDQQDLAGTLSDAFDQYDDQLEVYAGEDVCFKDETETDGNVGEEETNTEDVLADKDTFKCDQCDFSSHSANGVITHRRVHPPGGTSTNSRECGIEGCTFQSPSSYTVQRHENEVHFAGDNFDPALDEHCRALIQPVDERRHSKKHLRYLCKVCGAIRCGCWFNLFLINYYMTFPPHPGAELRMSALKKRQPSFPTDVLAFFGHRGCRHLSLLLTSPICSNLPNFSFWHTLFCV